MSHAFPPGPTSWIPFRLAMRFRRDPLGSFTELARTYGDVASVKVGPIRVVLISHPDLIRDVLVTRAAEFSKGAALQRAQRLLGTGLLTSEGDLHKRQRRLMQPAFGRRQLAAYAPVMTDFALAAAEAIEPGRPTDIAEHMMRLTLKVVARTLFGADFGNEAEAVGRTFDTLMRDYRLFRPAAVPLAALMEWLRPWALLRFRRCKAHLHAVIRQMIDRRRAEGTGAAEDRGDLLSMLLAARDAEGDGGGMSDAQIIDESLTLLAAGHETTANALTWTWWLLANHPEVEAEMHAELDRVLGGRPPTVEDVPNLEFTGKVLTESMRHYPPVYMVGRKPLADYGVGGYVLPRGTVIGLSQYVVHHDPRWYDAPHEFRPHRWTPEFTASLPKMAYFPFGSGPRVCIGEGFARMEGVLLLAAIAQRFRFRPAPGARVEVHPMITLRPKYGMWMVPERRT